MKDAPIGIYDSGIGGLTVLKEFIRLFPHENFVYFADSKNLPYGNKTKQQIIDFSYDIATWLQRHMHVKIVIAACHTSTCLALEAIAPQFDVPIIGTIQPILNAVLMHKKIGIIATEASIKSHMHEKIFRENGFDGQILGRACPDFVPLIEEGRFDELALSAQEALKPFHAFKPDALLYGCTHYPFARSIIEGILPVPSIDPARYMAHAALDILTARGLLAARETKGQIMFHCSQNKPVFENKAQLFMQHNQCAVF